MQGPVEMLAAILRSETEGERAVASLDRAGWEALLTQADRHAVSPLVHEHFSRAGSRFPVPPDVRSRLEDARHDHLAANARLLGVLGKLLERMSESGIDVIALKGAHLASLVYEDSGLRPMADVDLLVRKRDVGRAADLLRGLGYRPLRETPGNAAQEPVAEHLHIEPVQLPGEAPVEVHYSLEMESALPLLDVEGIWERAQSALVGGVPTKVLSTEDLLLHLCIHMAMHHGFAIRLGQLHDLPVIVGRHGAAIDWTALASRARDWGAFRCVSLAFSVAEGVFGPFLPEQASPILEDTGRNRQHASVARRLLLQGGTLNMERSHLPLLLGDASLPAKAGLVLRRAFPARAELAFTYRLRPGSASVLAYYPVHVWNLMRRHGRTLTGAVAKGRGLSEIMGVERDRAELLEWLKG